VVISKSSFFGNTIRSANDTGGVVLLANGTFELRVEQSCLCNNMRASFDCDTSLARLAVDNTTESEGASLRCPLVQFQAFNCTTSGCERRFPVVATTTTTTIAPTTASSTAISSSSSTAARVPETASSTSLDGGTVGAIIGGCIAGALIIGGTVAFVVIRKRKQKSPAASADAPRSTSEYGPIALKGFDDASSVRAPDSNYGSSLTDLK
jgi:hypothetical protein